jgi:hypothetical protein
MHGFITTRDVLRHPALIVSAFGFRVYLRAVGKILRGDRKATFLECI